MSIPQNSPEINHIRSNDYLQGCQAHAGAKNCLQQTVKRENRTYTCKRMKLGPYLAPYIKLKWIKDLKLKLLEENVGHKVHDIGLDDFDTRPKAWTRTRQITACENF